MITIQPARAWSLIAIDAESRQYAGNLGYDDDLSRTYRYDAAVANHKQLSQGDLIFVRDRERLIGFARIIRINAALINKTRQRCPICANVHIKTRKTRAPAWRCTGGHEFDRPNTEVVQIMGYEAHDAETFIATPEAVPVAEIRAAAIRPNDQLSIEELDLSQLERKLGTKFPATRELIGTFLDEQVINPFDAVAVTPRDAEEVLESEFISSMTCDRETILKAIKLRRGQRIFRGGLIREYGGRCMATGCDIIDILEAAHIASYRSESDNHLANGLLLRADIHTLFDLNLMAVDPSDLILRFHPRVVASGYGAFEGQSLKLVGTRRPAEEPLVRRWDIFQKRLLQF